MRAGAATFPPSKTRQTRQACPGWRALAAAAALALLGTIAASAQQLQNPRRITSGLRGQLIVSDRHLDYITGVDKRTLEVVWRVQLPGAPYGVARYGRRLFVGDTASQNVMVYRIVRAKTPEGLLRGRERDLKFLYTLGHNLPDIPGYLRKPTDIAIHGRSRLVFVLDSDDKKIKVYNVRGRYKYEFVPKDSNGRLLNPVALTVDPYRREVLVSDYGDYNGSFGISVAARILIYDLRGNLLRQIDGDGSTSPTTQFLRPQGLVTDARGNIFVTESITGQVLILNGTTGLLMGVMGTPGNQPGELQLPVDIYYDFRTGDVFVANNKGARRMEAFRAIGVRR